MRNDLTRSSCGILGHYLVMTIFFIFMNFNDENKKIALIRIVLNILSLVSFKKNILLIRSL